MNGFFPIRTIARAGQGVGLLAALLLALPAGGQPARSPLPGVAPAVPSPGIEASPSDRPAKSIEARLAEAQAQLAELNSLQTTNLPPGVTLPDHARRRALTDRLVRQYQQELANAAELTAVRTRREDRARAALTWSRFEESPPYSILLADRLREEISTARLKATSAENAITLLATLDDQGREDIEQAEETIRLLDEKLETAADAAATARLTAQRDLEKLARQVAAAGIAVMESERLVREEELAETRLRLGLLQRQLVMADAGAEFTQSDLDQVLGRIERERGQLESELAAVQTRRLVALEMLEAARAQAGSNGAAAPVLVALVTTREAQLQTADSVIRRLQLLLEGPNVERTLWELRFAGHQTENVHTLNASERRLRHLAGRLKVWHEKEQQQLDVSSSQIQLAESQLQNLPLNSDLRPLSRERLDTLRERDQVMRRLVSEIERLQRFTDRVTESLQAAEDRLPFTGRVQQLFAEAGSFTTKLWDFELFAIKDTITVDGHEITGKRTVTVGKIVLAIIILVIGIWLTGLVTRLLEPVFIKRLHIEPNEARLIRRWLRAGLIAGLVIFSLVSVKIPLTVFAFAGGALAIGLGFGMQTILKNFVSGLILLFERPFRIGDILNLGTQTGTVRSIGLRASVLHLWDGTETLIPNSTLLENNVTNWTYSDRKVRLTVTVGVAYGTDVRRVMELMQAAAERHGLVQKDPAPQVLFTDFAESCLTFELRYWVDITKANGAQVSSDLRMMIAGAFAENAISIAFPQRDLHLFADRPLAVQVVPPPAAPSAPVKPTEPKPPADSGASPHLP